MTLKSQGKALNMTLLEHRSTVTSHNHSPGSSQTDVPGRHKALNDD